MSMHVAGRTLSVHVCLWGKCLSASWGSRDRILPPLLLAIIQQNLQYLVAESSGGPAPSAHSVVVTPLQEPAVNSERSRVLVSLLIVCIPCILLSMLLLPACTPFALMCPPAAHKTVAEVMQSWNVDQINRGHEETTSAEPS